MLSTPNLAEAISRVNQAGIPVEVEKQAAALEKFLANAKIPEGESMFTYLRKANPQLFASKVEQLEAPEFLATLENYGLLSDQSIDAIAANILSVQEGIYGKGLSAYEALETPAGRFTSKRIIVNQDAFQESVRKIPGYADMPAEEKGRLTRRLWREIKAHERGHDIFLGGMRVLPQELQDEFADQVAKLSELKFAKLGKLPEEKMSGILKSFTNEGEDGALAFLVGKKGLTKLKKIPADYEFMKSVVHKAVAHADEMFAEAHSMYMLNPKGLQRRWPQAFGIMRKIYARQGWKTEWISEATQIPRKLATQNPEMFDIAQVVHRFQHETLEAEANAGVKAAKALEADISYTRHVITKEVREFLQARLFKGAKVWSTEHQAQVYRKFRNILVPEVDRGVKEGWLEEKQAAKLRKKGGLDHLDKLVDDGVLSREKANTLVHTLTVDEVNTLARQGKLKLLAGKNFDRFFEDNPAIQIKVRGVEGARARTSAEFFQAAKTFGSWGKELQPGFKRVKAESLNGWQFPEEIADHLDRYYESSKMPFGVHPFVDMFDNVQDIWKAWTLAIFPAYHTRNVVGNAWNNFLAGLVDPRHYLNARNIMQLKPFEMTTGYGEKFTGDQIIELMKRHDLWRIGQYGRDVQDLFEKEVKKASFLAKLRDNRILQTGRDIGSYLETNSYVAHFVWRLEQGYSPGAAAQSVKKYLFDYSDLTPFEKNVMKRVFPFYTWTRKNIPLQLEALVTRPGKPLGVLKVKNAIETNQDGYPDERYLPDWMVQNFAVRVRKDPKTNNYEYFLLGSWLPLADIDKIFRPDRLAMNMLTPLLKEPIQQVMNKDVFFNREIDQGGEYERLVGVNMPKRLSHVLKNIRALNEADKLTKTDLSNEAKITGLVTGKLYPLDVSRERKFRKNKEMEQDRQQSGMLNRARKIHDKGEVDRVLKLIKKTKEERTEFKRSGR
jgi:hypothetical protein